MGFWDWLGGKSEEPEASADDELAKAPTATDISASLTSVETLVADPAVPAVVRARARQITATVRNTLPRLDLLGLGSYDAYSVVATATDYLPEAIRRTLPRLGLLGLGSYDSYSVVATATDYLPEAIGAYLRLPRDWADSRPLEGGKTALLLLIDQLDLLSSTMEQIYNAANTTDAAALITHGRFLQEKFGHVHAPELNVSPE